MNAYLLSLRCLKWRSGLRAICGSLRRGRVCRRINRVSLAHATAIAERIQQKIHEAALPHEASEVAAVVTVSIGIVASDGTVPMETLIARADSALYQAKNKGRNQWSY